MFHQKMCGIFFNLHIYIQKRYNTKYKQIRSYIFSLNNVNRPTDNLYCSSIHLFSHRIKIAKKKKKVYLFNCVVKYNICIYGDWWHHFFFFRLLYFSFFTIFNLMDEQKSVLSESTININKAEIVKLCDIYIRFYVLFNYCKKNG